MVVRCLRPSKSRSQLGAYPSAYGVSGGFGAVGLGGFVEDAGNVVGHDAQTGDQFFGDLPVVFS